MCDYTPDMFYYCILEDKVWVEESPYHKSYVRVAIPAEMPIRFKPLPPKAHTDTSVKWVDLEVRPFVAPNGMKVYVAARPEVTEEEIKEKLGWQLEYGNLGGKR